MFSYLRWWGLSALLLSDLLVAQNVALGFAQNSPPYVFEGDNRGIELDIAREALAYRGHRLVPFYYPKERLALAFRYGRVDGAMMDAGEDLSKEGGHYAEPAVLHDNVLITLKQKRVEISAPSSLQNQVVVSFIGAQQRYDDWLSQPAEHGLYFETPDQKTQVLGLYRGHFDVMLTDRYVFDYWSKTLADERGLELKPVIKYRLQEVTVDDCRPVFNDPKLRDDFNAGLLHLKESGRFDEIYQSYLYTAKTE